MKVDLGADVKKSYTITSAGLEKIIRAYFGDQGEQVIGVKFEVRIHCEDRSNDSYPVFDGATVHISAKGDKS